jgi:hypothetical protein
LDTIHPEQIMKILELTDSFNVHREAVVIPLAAYGEGSVTIGSDHRLRIVVPENKPFEQWFSELRVQLGEMDLSSLRH